VANGVVVDTGPLIAALNPHDDEHVRCASWLASYRGKRLLPSTVMAEVCWNLERFPQTEADFVASVSRGEFTLVNLDPEHMNRVSELVNKYGDWPLGAIDASVVAVAESLNLTDIATLDHGHFRAIRPRHVEVFTLHP
jgi:predicted nucleic acid-binding protein